MRGAPTALLLGVSLALCAGIARADAPPTPVPDKKPDLSAMTYFIGTWKCHSTTRGSPRPNTTVYTMDYDGRWIKAHDTAPPFDKYRTRTIITDTWLTYNPDNHKWMQTSIDNFGGYGISSSPGWVGNKITTTIDVANDGTTGSDTLTKTSDTETTDTFMGKDKNGKALPAVTTICKKS